MALDDNDLFTDQTTPGTKLWGGVAPIRVRVNLHPSVLNWPQQPGLNTVVFKKYFLNETMVWKHVLKNIHLTEFLQCARIRGIMVIIIINTYGNLGLCQALNYYLLLRHFSFDHYPCPQAPLEVGTIIPIFQTGKLKLKEIPCPLSHSCWVPEPGMHTWIWNPCQGLHHLSLQGPCSWFLLNLTSLHTITSLAHLKI